MSIKACEALMEKVTDVKDLLELQRALHGLTEEHCSYKRTALNLRKLPNMSSLSIRLDEEIDSEQNKPKALIPTYQSLCLVVVYTFFVESVFYSLLWIFSLSLPMLGS